MSKIIGNNYICKTGYLRMWILRRLRVLGANQTELLDVYQKQVISLLKFAMSVWQPGITKHKKYQIERVQKCLIFNYTTRHTRT